MRDKIDKSSWGPGPWQTEPDEFRWKTAAGLDGLILRHGHHGSLCGYVGVDIDHVDYERGYDDIENIDVHGGLTFAGPHTSQDGDLWWLGFDCAHFQDFLPGLEARMRKYDSTLRNPDDVYRDFAYVTREVEKLAAQLAERLYA